MSSLVQQGIGLELHAHGSFNTITLNKIQSIKYIKSHADTKQNLKSL